MSTVGNDTGSIELSVEETECKDKLDQREISQGERSLQNECQSSKLDIHTPEGFFAPIQGVPLEVLHEIIIYCLPVHPTIQSASPVISTLSLVSSTWRTAVLWSPRPWSTLFVTVYYDDDLNKCAQVVSRWFQHARSISLSFFLNIRFNPQLDDVTRIHTFLTDLSSIMPRVWHFGLHARLTEPLLRSFVGLEWTLPRLKILDLFSHSGFDKLNAVAFSSSIFHNAPNLVRISIQNSISSARDIQHILPWSQLTRINMAYTIYLSRWIEIMDMCPMLRSCDVSLRPSYDPLNSYLPKCTTSRHNLVRLDLDTNGLVPFLEPLSLYNFPCLKTLNVCHLSSRCSPSPHEVSALRNLQSFSFNSGSKILSYSQVTYLAEALREMVNLEVFNIQQTTSDFIRLYGLMSYKTVTETPILLPLLSKFQIWITTFSEGRLGENEELDTLIEMISSRSRKDSIPVGCSPLREFTVGVENGEIYERTKMRFGSWVRRLPPQFPFEIVIRRDFRFDQPEGWTYPISD